MPGQDGWVVVGVDNGGTANNGTVLDAEGHFLIDRMAEIPSYVREGPDKAVQALVDSVEHALGLVDLPRSAVRAVGLDTPGPASAAGVLSSRGATNFASPEWWGYDIRSALEDRLGLPVVYNNDGNAAALYAHHTQYGAESGQHSSVAAIVGTGLGGGVVEAGRVIGGAAGMAGELGHVPIPMDGLLEHGQPLPACNCGQLGDVESVASLTGIEKNLLPYWLTRFGGTRTGSGGAAREGRQDGAAIRGGRRQTRAEDLRAAGDGSRPAVHDRGQLHRSRHLFRRWRRGRGRPAFPRLVPGPRPRALHAARRAGPGGPVRAGAGPRHGRGARLSRGCPRLAAPMVRTGRAG